MANKYINDALAKLPNGEYVKGPITTEDNVTYLFVNRFSEMDFYVLMQKNENGWYQSGGPDIKWPQDMIDELGVYIDNTVD